MKHLNRPFSIVSAYKSELSDNVNMTRHLDLVDSLKKASIPFEEVYGVYKGGKERCVLLIGPGNDLVAHSIANEFEQECYLVSDQDRNTKLVFEGGVEEDIGVFTRIHTTEGFNSYTVDPETGEKWACV